LLHPEEVIVPDEAFWPKEVVTAGAALRYPADARRAGVEGRVVAAFVIDTMGRVEYPTISIVQATSYPGFVRSVCDYLRLAEFKWADVPARALVVMPFEFRLPGPGVTAPLPAKPDLRAVTDSVARLSAQQRSAWIESMPHCR
jgi:TonB family protein